MASVQHGRRRGTPHNENKEKFLILSSKEWQAIQDRKNKVVPPEVQQQINLRNERESKHKLSVDQVKTWDNTIVGKRNARLNARKLREEQEELERKKVDLHEAELKAAKRKSAIEHAKKLQYYQTDRVKGFHSALLLSEVLNERQAQIALKEEIRAATNKAAMRQNKADVEHNLQLDRVAREEEETKRAEAMRTRAAQLKQKEEKDKLLIAERVQDIEEGKRIQRDTEEYMKELEEKDKKAMEKRKKISEECLRQIELNNEIREQEARDEAQRNTEIKLYANAKRRMAKLRSDKQQELFDTFQEQQSAIRNRLAAYFKQQVDDEDSRILAAVQERDAKERKREEESARNRYDMLQDINNFRLQTMRLDEEKRAKDKEDAHLDLQRRLEEDRIYFEEKSVKDRLKLDELREIQDIQIAQRDDRKRKSQLERQEELEQEGLVTRQLQDEEDEFQRYADAVIQQAKERNKPLVPLLKAKHSGAGGGRGPVLHDRGKVRPSYQSQDTEGYQLPKMADGTGKELVTLKDTDKRMGFVW